MTGSLPKDRHLSATLDGLHVHNLFPCNHDSTIITRTIGICWPFNPLARRLRRTGSRCCRARAPSPFVIVETPKTSVRSKSWVESAKYVPPLRLRAFELLASAHWMVLPLAGHNLVHVAAVYLTAHCAPWRETTDGRDVYPQVSVGTEMPLEQVIVFLWDYLMFCSHYCPFVQR